MLVGGLEVPAPDVHGALVHLAAFQRDFERVFLALAEGLPDLSRSVEDLTAHFHLSQGHEGCAAGKIEAEVDHMVRESQAATERVLSYSQSGLAAANSLGVVATSLAQRLAAAEQVSLKLRLAGMNASFTAHGLGERGAAFSAVNRALIEVAEESAFLAERMAASAQATSEAANELGVDQQALAKQIAETTAANETRSLGAMEACSTALKQLDPELQVVVARAREVVEATKAVMLVIQQQDIIRQGVDHVILVLQALQAEFESVAASEQPASRLMAFLTFQARAGQLAAALLESLRGQLEALVVAVNKPVDGIKGMAGAIAERIRDHSGLESALSAPAVHFSEGFAGLPRFDAPLASCEEGAGRLQAQITALKPKLILLEQIPLQISLVAVLMKVEIAHTEALSGAATVAEALREVSRSFRDLHLTAADAMEIVRDRVALVRTAVNRQRASWASLRRLPASIEQAARRVKSISTAFGEQLGRLAGAGHALEHEAGTLQRGLLAFGESLASTDSIRDTCARFHDDAKRLQAQFLDRGYELADAPDSLRALIERFTLFEHKEIARTPTGRPHEQHGQPGELTLF